MEAWEQGIGRVKESKLASCLRAIARLPMIQRVGYVLDILGYKPGTELNNILQECLSQLNPDDPDAPQQLYPGVQYECLKQPWLIYGPA